MATPLSRFGNSRLLTPCGTNYMTNPYTAPALDVTVENGKYRIIQDSVGHVIAFRYDDYSQMWRDCTGDKLVLALAQEVQALRDQINKNQERPMTDANSQRDE